MGLWTLVVIENKFAFENNYNLLHPISSNSSSKKQEMQRKIEDPVDDAFKNNFKKIFLIESFEKWFF